MPYNELPYGTYSGELKECGTYQKATKAPYVELTFHVQYRWDDASQTWIEMGGNYTAKIFLSLSEKTWEMAEKALYTLGFNGDFANPVCESPGNGAVQLVCYEDSYQGKTRARWDLAEMRSGAQQDPIKGDIARQLTAKWRAKSAMNRPATGRPAPPPRPAQTPPAAPPEIDDGPPLTDADVPDDAGVPGDGIPY